MKTSKLLPVKVITLTVVWLITTQSAIAQEVTFTFHPPDSITYLQTVTTTKNTEMGQMGKRDEVMEAEVRVTIMQTGDGYRLIFTPLSMSATRNGQKIDDPMLALFQNIVVEYQLDKDGKLLGISGYEKLMDVMQQLVPAEMIEKLSSVLNEETLKNRDAAEWDGQIGKFIGQTISLGDSWASVDSFPLPSGESITFYSVTRFPEQVKCGEHDCVKISFDYNSDISTLSAIVNQTVQKLMGQPADSLPATPSTGNIVGSGERIIDPATMLIQSEYVERTLTTKMTIPGQGDIDLTQTERREYKFDYSY